MEAVISEEIYISNYRATVVVVGDKRCGRLAVTGSLKPVYGNTLAAIFTVTPEAWMSAIDNSAEQIIQVKWLLVRSEEMLSLRLSALQAEARGWYLAPHLDRQQGCYKFQD